jgi:hypothetical protein
MSTKSCDQYVRPRSRAKFGIIVMLTPPCNESSVASRRRLLHTGCGTHVLRGHPRGWRPLSSGGTILFFRRKAGCKMERSSTDKQRSEVRTDLVRPSNGWPRRRRRRHRRRLLHQLKRKLSVRALKRIRTAHTSKGWLPHLYGASLAPCASYRGVCQRRWCFALILPLPNS